jgi:hypothetical protein
MVLFGILGTCVGVFIGAIAESNDLTWQDEDKKIVIYKKQFYKLELMTLKKAEETKP